MLEPWGGFIEMDYRLPSQVHTVLTNALAIVGWTRLPEACPDPAPMSELYSIF